MHMHDGADQASGDEPAYRLVDSPAGPLIRMTDHGLAALAKDMGLPADLDLGSEAECSTEELDAFDAILAQMRS